MRLAPTPVRARLPWTLAALSVAVIGCGGGDAPPATTPTASSTATPAAQPPVEPAAQPAGQPAAQPGDVAASAPQAEPEMTELVPFKAQIEGPIEYETAVDKPLIAVFPEPVDVARPSIPDLPADDPILGRPLVINGKLVPFEDIRKQMCLNSIGAAEIADARIKIFVDEERARLAGVGAPQERYELGATEVADYIKTVEDNLKTEFPEGEIDVDDVMRSLASHDPKEKLAIQIQFSKLFMPDDPADFPPLTQEAILKQQGGQQVLEHYQQVAESRKGVTGPIVKDEAERQFDGAIMQQILAHLMDVASIVADPAPGVLYRVNGVDITMDSIWGRIKDRVTAADVLTAKQWIVNSTVLCDALTAAGAWLNDEEAFAAYFAHSDPYKDSIFSQERVALMVKMFPSIEYYKQYRRFYDSFQRMHPPTAEELKQHSDYRTKKIVGQVSADVDVVLCAAFEIKTNEWKEDGWMSAENRMRDVLDLLVEEQRPWEELLERYSDFYEPPVPMSQRPFQAPPTQRKGQFRNMQRNALLPQLGESDYTLFLNGTSVTDFIFFDQEVGSLGQPLRGPWGWYLPRLLRRTRAPERVSMDQATMDALVLDDYLTYHLNAWTQKLIQESEVYGLAMPGGHR
jgi:hypothetical protein